MSILRREEMRRRRRRISRGRRVVVSFDAFCVLCLMGRKGGESKDRRGMMGVMERGMRGFS
tara:strand:+ start:232 stop:414 length:183 start_codon:yes stop_codon:yes gene_type:complete